MTPKPPPETWPGANDARFTKLRAKMARIRAKKRGLALRHSDRGYSLVDGQNNRVIVDERSSLTLDEVEEYLRRP